MDGFVISGKAFVVCEELRALAERNKGLTVVEMLKQQNIQVQQVGASTSEHKEA